MNRPAHLRPRLSLAAVLAPWLSFAAACKVGPDYVVPDVALPDEWHHAALSGLEQGEANLQTWWKVLGDPVLDELIERAGRGSLDLKVAALRVAEARALRGIVAADRVPTVDLDGSASRGQPFSDDLFPGIGTIDQYQLGISLAWELDVWGRVARSVESADASITATVEDFRDVMVLLYAEVALNYIDVRSLQARIRYAQSNVDAQEATLQLTRDRVQAQIAPELDVQQAELNLARTESALPTLRILLFQAMHRIAVLLGEHPDGLYGLLADESPVPSLPADVAVGIPADILRQRPDVRAAERALAAQTAQIGVATAELYPQFALTGNFGWSTTSSSSLFDSAGQVWSIGVPFRWNLFDRKRIKGNIAAQEALAEELQAAYEQTILVALEEVENSLVGYGEETLRRDALARSVQAAENSVELVQTLYRTGLTNFQNVLDMQRSLFQQQDEFASSEGEVVKQLILLYRSLGGGWSPPPPPPDEEVEQAP